MSGVEGQRLGGRIEELGQVDRVGQRVRADRLVGHRGDERLLALHPADVRAVAERVPLAHVVERLVAAELVGAGGQCDVADRVVHGVRDADLDPADRVDHRLEPVEVDDDVVVDADAGELLELLDRAAGAADVEGVVPHRSGGGRRDLLAGVVVGRPAGSTIESRGMLTPYACCRSPERCSRIVVSDRLPMPVRLSMWSPGASRLSEPMIRMLIGPCGPFGACGVGRSEPSSPEMSLTLRLPL